MDFDLLMWLAGAGSAGYLINLGHERLQLSRAKHPGLAGHVRMAKRLSRLMPYYELKDQAFFDCDSADAALVNQRKTGFFKLSERLAQRAPVGAVLMREAIQTLSDAQFTYKYRVPFQFRHMVNEHLQPVLFLSKSEGVRVWDVDNNAYIDLTGAYGTNLLGYDHYKRFIEEAASEMHTLGPVLGPYHPVVLDNARRILSIAGQDEISFHMSGTEAVMQAVRLAQYHTGKERLVRFAGAYHGWWGDVQPGVGNPVTADRTITLQDLSERSLKVLATRRDIACVLVNPLQALHPNSNAPGDSALLNSARKAGYDKAAYTAWLQALRRVCTDRGIVLIFDEVFLGFRLAKGGAQDYFGVRADLVTYGKTLGGGLPVGVLCGKTELMRRYSNRKPADICFARGTFNSHPYVMHTMNAFLRYLDAPEAAGLYNNLDALWNGRCAQLNQRLKAAQLPVEVRNMASVWTIVYARASRFNWMFQFYLLDAGLLLSWVGSGRMIFSHAFNDMAFDEVCQRFVQAALAMQADGWWEAGEACNTNQKIQRRVLLESWRAFTSSMGSMSWPFNR
ncbi:aminotransferase class III-fold pyridoxal phosphate-dependent enzyme [Limnobacter humi]|uniref:Aminotransferase class III-fold pyridoxal phosphate-dependent enzyme n=1 Tax=Limnobacter humi TaxID=1778671 RepID=A0ABT1WF48_9BURK|nr:aminotransferase class III-fold pyridoxal phosphate-dependent enzyme [Limnobacter humi]MCQ8896130.1 aminotransferase class III-fold pyridoxal phosphate-dependent enzyme [Limnobacter humi]